MSQSIFTLGEWRAKPGSEQSFVAAWKDLAAIFLKLPQPPAAGVAKLVQSLAEPTLFYSFGPWPNLAAVQAMRTDPAAQAGIARLRELCTEARPGSFQVVAEA